MRGATVIVLGLGLMFLSVLPLYIVTAEIMHEEIAHERWWIR